MDSPGAEPHTVAYMVEKLLSEAVVFQVKALKVTQCIHASAGYSSMSAAKALHRILWQHLWQKKG